MTCTRDELVGVIGDVMVRQLPPEWSRVAIQRRVNGADADDLLLAALTLLREQDELIAVLEREAVVLVRRVDRLEIEIDDLNNEIEALRTILRNFRYSHDDLEGTDDDNAG